MNRAIFPQTGSAVCLMCMRGTVVNGRCRVCGSRQTQPERPPDALPLNYRLKDGRYIVGKTLGRGGFGITYLCWDSEANDRVALKELFPNRMSRSPDQELIVPKDDQSFYRHIKKRFLDEANLIYALRAEPLILNVHDFFEENATVYYTMEYLEGTDLQHIFRAQNERMSWNELRQPISQVMQGLEILHRYDLIHRDISPDNIFVCSSGVTKLIDFGSVRSENADHFTTILKADFAPPELFSMHGHQGPWTDTYSLCATIYYLLSGGKFPTQPEPRAQEIALKGHDPLKPLSSFRTDAPEYVQRGVMYGLNLQENERFRSIEQMRRALFPNEQPARGAAGVSIECVRGIMAGRSFPVQRGEYLKLGRGATAEPGVGAISYPMNTPGISRRQCVFYLDQNDQLYLQDLRSSYGTRIGNREIPPEVWVTVAPGQVVIVGDDHYLVKQ